MKKKTHNRQPTHLRKQAIHRGLKPTVSVIMPVYNAAPYLREALDSVRRQTLRNWELLVIDDASTDGSYDILRDYAARDKRIKVYRNRTNRGLVYSLNRLIPLTRGTFVARMDADDISLPDRFRKQVRWLRRNPELIAVGGQETIIDERGLAVAYKYFPTDPATCYRMIMNFMVIQPPLLMAYGDAMRKLRYDNHLFRNDDISMHFKLLQYGQFGNVDSVIFKYRKRADSITHQAPKQVFFRALLVRINAIRHYGYRPGMINAFIALAEALVVAALPTQLILALFEVWRHSTRPDTRIARRDNFGLSAALS